MCSSDLQRSMPTNKRPLPPRPRAPFFEPDTNLTVTSIPRSALASWSLPLPPAPRPRRPHQQHSTASPSPVPGALRGARGKAPRSRTGPRPHARTHTAPPHPPRPALSTALYTRPPRWPADLVPCSHPRAGGADAALWVPEGPGGSDDPPTHTHSNPDRAERTAPHPPNLHTQTHTREKKGAIKVTTFVP